MTDHLGMIDTEKEAFMFKAVQIKDRRLQIPVDDVFHRQVSEAARDNGRSISSLVRYILRLYIEGRLTINK